MRAFACPNCGLLAFFENSVCVRCQTPLGFRAPTRELLAIGPPPAPDGGPGGAAAGSGGAQDGFVRGANAATAECNWILTEEEHATHDGLCLSCRLTRTRPNDHDITGLAAFAETEAAKRRLVFQLLDLGLPVDPYDEGVEEGLAFDLLSSQFAAVTTGHDDGLITLDLAEADDAYREEVRTDLGEAYRTLLGHLRHEIGHYYWPILIRDDGPGIERVRALFGDERLDYGEALDAHYQNGPPADWRDHYVSSYATMHPWEDWAETFAHYLHIRDTLQTAAAFGVSVAGPDAPTDAREYLEAVPEADVTGRPFTDILDEWLPLTYALNAINRSMGHGDLYPFVLAPAVIDKLTFVHDLMPVGAITPASR